MRAALSTEFFLIESMFRHNFNSFDVFIKFSFIFLSEIVNSTSSPYEIEEISFGLEIFSVGNFLMNKFDSPD